MIKYTRQVDGQIRAELIQLERELRAGIDADEESELQQLHETNVQIYNAFTRQAAEASRLRARLRIQEQRDRYSLLEVLFFAAFLVVVVEVVRWW